MDSSGQIEIDEKKRKRAPNKRRRHGKQGRPWAERHDIVRIMSNEICKGEQFKTNINFDKLMEASNSNVTTTNDEAAELGDLLPLLSRSKITTFTSEDNQRLLTFIPDALHGVWHKDRARHLLGSINRAVDTLHDGYKAPVPNDKRHFFQDIPVDKPYGVYHFCLWKKQGYPNSDPLCSAHICNRGSERLNLVFDFFQAIAPLIQTVGILFASVDRELYQKYFDTYNAWCKNKIYQVFQVADRACFLGLAVLRNARVGPHKDNNDIKDGWVAMFCFGKWDGGELVVPALKVKIPFQQGDMIFMRSAVFEHWVQPFAGHRTSFVFFTKKEMELEDGRILRHVEEESSESLFKLLRPGK
jgi:hypothetical protein